MIHLVFDSLRSPYDLANVIQVALATQLCEIHLCGSSLSHGHEKVAGKVRSWSKALRSGEAIGASINYHASLQDAVNELKAMGCWVVGTSPHVKESYLDVDFSRDTIALVFGTETSGLSTMKVALMDQMVTVPMSEQLDFMTLSVVTPVIVYEALRQRRAAGLV